MRNGRRQKRRGFTLLEIMMVIALIVMLGGLAILGIGRAMDSGRTNVTKVLVETEVPKALDMFNLNMGRYPTDEEGLKALREKPAALDEKEGEKWSGPYLTKDPLDGWKHELHYEASQDAAEGAPSYKLWSDGKNGTSGDDDDIKNYTDANAP